MLKRICPHCGRTYAVGTQCDCAQSRRKKREQRKDYDRLSRNKDAASFYHSSGWEKLSDAVRRRSSYADTLQSYLAILIRRGMLLHYVQNQQTDAGRNIVKTLVSLLVSDTGVPVQFQTKRVRLVVHHVVPRDDDKSREYDPDNLIALLPVVHNLVHDYYDSSDADKESMQRILFDAINYFK